MSLRDYIIEIHPQPAKPVPIFSSDGIKLVFDVVRNYGLALLVFAGASEFSKVVDPLLIARAPIGWFLAASVFKWLFYAVAVVLLVMNGLYATYVFEVTPFYLARAQKFRWAIFSVFLCTMLGAVLCGAIYLARRHAT